MTKPLAGVRIADFTRYFAGAGCTAILGMLGAEVIKIESIKAVDFNRLIDRVLGKRDISIGGPAFVQANMNKTSMCLDITTPQGQEVARKLILTSDVVAENFRPGVMDRAGLGYEQLRKLKPDIIMLSSSGFGAYGPIYRYRGNATVFGAISGIGDLIGYPGGPPGEAITAADWTVAHYNAFVVMAALRHRKATGQGMYIDESGSEALTTLIGEAIVDYSMNGRVEGRRGNKDDVIAPSDCYPCKGDDNWISIAIATDEEWQALCDVMGKPELAGDERFADCLSRWKNQDELEDVIGAWTRTVTHYQAMHTLQAAGVAAIPVFSAADIASDPHVAERKVARIVDHKTAGASWVIVPSWAGTDPEDENDVRHSPLLGEQTHDILSNILGFSEAEIAELHEGGILR